MKHLIACTVLVLMLAGCGGTSNGDTMGLQQQTNVVTFTRQDVPSVLPPLRLNAQSFNLEQISVLMATADPAAQMQIDTSKCTPLVQNGMVVPGEYTNCALSFLFGDQSAGLLTASMQTDGKILLTRQNP